jgi:hypothetical protein
MNTKIKTNIIRSGEYRFTKDGTFAHGGYIAHSDGRISGVSVNGNSAPGIVVRGSNSDNFAAYEVQNILVH